MNRNADLGVPAATPGATASFRQDVQPIFTASCATAFCHGSPLGAPMSLLSADSYASLVGAASCEAAALKRVAPGDSAGSYLVVKLEGTQSAILAAGGCQACSISGGSVANCGSRMPLTGPPYLPDAEIRLIRDWIDQGAENN
jgi:hypothetical protein